MSSMHEPAPQPVAKDLEFKAKECEATLPAEESKIMMADLSALDPARRA
jgi:hypothetical protein